jgi:hypothetical protein
MLLIPQQRHARVHRSAWGKATTSGSVDDEGEMEQHRTISRPQPRLIRFQAVSGLLQPP